MSNLSDIKLRKLNSLSNQGGFWYITKQNLVFRDLCFMAKILDDWNDRPEENYESFFNNHKILPEYGELGASTAHRATKNCEYLGLIRPSERYSAQNLTPFYFALKDLCKGDFDRLSLYPNIINKQLERIFIDSSLNALYTSQIKICPFMFLFKILLLIGDITNSYKITTQEFKLFVATAQTWKDYFAVVESIIRYRNDTDFKSASDANFSKVSDVRYNILAQNHSQLEVTSTEIAIKQGNEKNIRRKVAEYELNDTLQNAKDIFSAIFVLNNPLQQIFYGAPGTGKSYTIDKYTTPDNSIRTTFHPDSDYSTFVGCYKPQKEGDKITYGFSSQAFTKAYVAAWKNTESAYYLVIEEINRGNCAQIFGDIFQLLDRDDDGCSKYMISPDDDLRKHLKLEFYNYDIADPKVKSGEILKLPSNLHIWATMNTSDQSLFPIDSAFKRRWNWKYMPIKDASKELEANGKKPFFVIKEEFKWWEFIEKINERILSATHSEDKQLGYWFAKGDDTGKIDVDTFVSKVVYYLWNDVFKDYGRSKHSPFVEGFHFHDFFDEKGDAIETKAIAFIESILELNSNSPSDGAQA